ncbi:hypothetical protein GLAREA_03211 [Glarea lozoyensis ATCC 20868]|uniref:Uncharacterized protein n=1 Tax=Glarea lozoyensis (strain ATCC 20868 / MF5171) TaxID=1116229 RepID=S3D5G3_GLAL2|nr:uncharacterized protein GLAREA_03211 [Glarea lozoyensis ATCC 20868]EPE27296.1 hypothetical protein GLAREA_03211 [Glarea lozoyensis ATCC 20868]
MSSSHHEKKQPRSLQHRTPTANTKSPIATPPRAALGRSKIDHGDNASIKSVATVDSTAPPNGNEDSDGELESDRKKISELEKEVETMASEFERELTQLSHKVTNERESSQFWQQKHTALHQRFLDTDTSLRLLRSEVATLQTAQAANVERDREIKTRISSLMLDRDGFREAYHEAVKEVGEKEDEIAMLRNQVRGLKSWVSKGGRGGEEQVSDEAVAEGWGKLGNGLQNWVIVHFRRVKIDTSTATPETKTHLTTLLPNHASLPATCKIHLIQSLLSHLLLTHIFSAYFPGLPTPHAASLESLETYLSTFGPPETLNAWRAQTLSLLRRAPPESDALTSSLTAELNTLLHALTSLPSTPARDASLLPLLHSAITLTQLLRSQKARFEIHMPAIAASAGDATKGGDSMEFDPETMEDVGGSEDEGGEREVKLVVWPGVIKYGDENGERVDLRNVVCRVRVLCGEG